jgi:hypothetical protein
MRFFDKEGKPISAETWKVLKCYIDDYSIIKQEYINEYFISTVWLGLDHSYSNSKIPLKIFETMIFDRDEGKESWFDEYMERCATLEEAYKMHEDAVNFVKNKGLTI